MKLRTMWASEDNKTKLALWLKSYRYIYYSACSCACACSFNHSFYMYYSCYSHYHHNPHHSYHSSYYFSYSILSYHTMLYYIILWSMYINMWCDTQRCWLSNNIYYYSTIILTDRQTDRQTHTDRQTCMLCYSHCL